MILVLVLSEKFRKTKGRFGSFSYVPVTMSVSLSTHMLRKMMLWHVVFLVCLMAARADDFGVSRRTPAQSQQPAKQPELPYVARIIAFDSSGQSFGTGSYVGTYGEYGVVLTNSHVVCATKGLVHVHFPSGFSSFGAVVESDPQWDLALIAISKPPQSIPLLTISRTPSKPGDPLWIVGWGSGTYRIAGGQCVQYLALPNQTDSPREIVEVSVSARKGDSGGPILNQKGELAGVLFGSDMIRNTAGSYCKRVNHFLTETQSKIADYPSRPETHFATVEKNRPLHTLQESRNATPQNTQGVVVPQRPDGPGASVSLPGVRSTSRRYVAPTTYTRQPQVPLGRPSAMLGGTPTSLSPMPGAEQVETLPKFGTPFQPAKIEQTAQLVPLEPVSMPMMIPASNPVAADRYPLKLSSDRSDPFFSLFLSLNVCLAAGLTCVAVRLLHA